VADNVHHVCRFSGHALTTENNVLGFIVMQNVLIGAVGHGENVRLIFRTAFRHVFVLGLRAEVFMTEFLLIF